MEDSSDNLRETAEDDFARSGPKRESMRQKPAGVRFDELTSWTRDETLQQRVLQTVHMLPANSWCLDVGGGSGRLALSGSRIRSDLNWLTLDVVPPQPLMVREDRVCGICADAANLPFTARSISWLSYRSSLHYIGLDQALNEAARVGLMGATLVILTKVADQFETCFDWYMKLHRARSVIEREVYYSSNLLEQVASHGFTINRWNLFYRWTDYDLTGWLDRGGSLAASQSSELRAVLRDATTAVAVDGMRPIYVSKDRIHNRLQWIFIESKLDEFPLISDAESEIIGGHQDD